MNSPVSTFRDVCGACEDPARATFMAIFFICILCSTMVIFGAACSCHCKSRGTLKAGRNVMTLGSVLILAGTIVGLREWKLCQSELIHIGEAIVEVILLLECLEHLMVRVGITPRLSHQKFTILVMDFGKFKYLTQEQL